MSKLAHRELTWVMNNNELVYSVLIITAIVPDDKSIVRFAFTKGWWQGWQRFEGRCGEARFESQSLRCISFRFSVLPFFFGTRSNAPCPNLPIRRRIPTFSVPTLFRSASTVSSCPSVNREPLGNHGSSANLSVPYRDVHAIPLSLASREWLLAALRSLNVQSICLLAPRQEMSWSIIYTCPRLDRLTPRRAWEMWCQYRSVSFWMALITFLVVISQCCEWCNGEGK